MYKIIAIKSDKSTFLSGKFDANKLIDIKFTNYNTDYEYKYINIYVVIYTNIKDGFYIDDLGFVKYCCLLDNEINAYKIIATTDKDIIKISNDIKSLDADSLLNYMNYFNTDKLIIRKKSENQITIDVKDRLYTQKELNDAVEIAYRKGLNNRKITETLNSYTNNYTVCKLKDHIEDIKNKLIDFIKTIE